MSKMKKEIYTLQGGRVIDVRECLDARYGSRAERAERTKPTEEQIQKVNARNKANLCRMRMLEYIKLGDLFATWTYNPKIYRKPCGTCGRSIKSAGMKSSGSATSNGAPRGPGISTW